MLNYFLIFILFLTYLLISSLSSHGNLLVAIKTVISFILPVLSLLLLMTIKDNSKYLLKIMCVFTALIGFSSLITFLFFVVFQYQDILLFQFEIPGYPKAGLVYFPFTVSSGAFSSFDILVLRTSGYMREPGIFQAFAIFFYFINEVFYKSKFLRFGCFLSLVFTFSTTGYVLFFVSLSIYLFIQCKNKFFGLIAMFMSFITTVLLFLFTPGIGYYDKQITHSSSITERGDAVSSGLARFLDNPFGVGYLSNIDNTMGNINMLASIGQVGIIGFILTLLLFTYPVINTNKEYRLYSIMLTTPIFLTALFSQPLYDTPGTYFCMIIWLAVYPHLYNTSTNKF